MLPSGDQSAVEPPGPIPNPEVKRRSANGSGTKGPVRVGRRQVYARLQAIGAGLFFCSDRDGKAHSYRWPWRGIRLVLPDPVADDRGAFSLGDHVDGSPIAGERHSLGLRQAMRIHDYRVTQHAV